MAVILSDRDIAAELQSGRLVIEPMDEQDLQPASVDVHLGDQVLVQYTDGWRPADITGGLVLAPGAFALGTTVETLGIPDDILCLVHGLSSVGRGGLQIHCAGLVDPGWQGQITLELSNLGACPVVLVPGMRIAQLTFERMSSPAMRPYGSPGVGRYQFQSGPTPPRPGRCQ